MFYKRYTRHTYLSSSNCSSGCESKKSQSRSVLSSWKTVSTWPVSTNWVTLCSRAYFCRCGRCRGHLRSPALSEGVWQGPLSSCMSCNRPRKHMFDNSFYLHPQHARKSQTSASEVDPEGCCGQWPWVRAALTFTLHVLQSGFTMCGDA